MLRSSSTRVRVGDKNTVLMGFPDVPVSNYHRINRTQLYSRQDQARRYTYGPAWQDNSCAMDSVLIILLLLDAGRVQADQISELLYKKSPAEDLSRVVMNIIRKPWGSLLRGDRIKLRDVVRNGLAGCDPQVFELASYQGADSIWNTLATSIPQCLATYGKLVRCCPKGFWSWRIRNGALRTVVYNSLSLTTDMVEFATRAPTFSAQVQLLLNPRPADNVSRHIPRCKSCKASEPAPQHQLVLLDRPPPTLALQNFTFGDDHSLAGIFDEIQLTFTAVGPDGMPTTITASYACHSVIFCLRSNHFVTLINKAARIGGANLVLYNDMARDGQLLAVSEDFKDYAGKTGYRVQLLVYVRLDK